MQSFGVPPTTIATGIVMYSLAVAGFVMLGAKPVRRFGSTRVSRVVVASFGIAQVLMTFSQAAMVMLVAQLCAGLAAAVIVPALVALIAHHYRGEQQATAVGALGSARAGPGVLAFLIGGILGTFIGWRPVFGTLIAVSALVFLLSFKLKPEEGRPEVGIDVVGVVLAATAIILIGFGFNNLTRWGLGLARPGARFEIVGLSPAPIMIVVGVFLLQAFLTWTRRAQPQGRTPLLDLCVITSSREKAAVICMFAVVALEAMLNFSVPLYIQIGQGRTPLETAVAMLPFNLASQQNHGLHRCLRGRLAEAVRINTESRIQAIKIGLLLMAGVAFLAIFPAGRLPDFKPGQIPAHPEPESQEALKAAAQEVEKAEAELRLSGARV
ncbi:MFS transporter [Elioraea thermophila]|uniref:MFS transporter n=1 Tax=Elioraea thermophila TaxID=2185104 RepID=UPI0018E51DA7|nr:MFS transporter [Elioraea thermophila]